MDTTSAASGTTVATSKDPVEINVSLVNILDYVGDSTRPIREGSRVFESKHVVCVGYTHKNDQSVQIKGYVNQSSHPNLPPHELCLKLTDNFATWYLNCSCKAGTRRCKHLIAVLLYLNQMSTVDYLSCTDVTQAWGIYKGAKNTLWGATKISQLCCVKKRTIPENIDVELKDKIVSESFSKILEAAKESAFFKHRAGRALNDHPKPANRVYQTDHPDACDNPGVFCSVPEIVELILNDNCNVQVNACTFSNEQEKEFFFNHVQLDFRGIAATCVETQTQSTNVWKIERSRRITASSCYSLYTYLRNPNPDWESKINRYLSTKNIKTEAMQYGKITESKAFDCYIRKRNPLIKKCGLVIKASECWFAASPDGVDPLNKIVLEIKCPVAGESSTLQEMASNETIRKYLKICPNTGAFMLNENHSYYCQVQLNLWALQCQECDFIIYSLKEDDFILVEVKFDYNYVQRVVNDLKTLYFSKILGRLAAKC